MMRILLLRHGAVAADGLAYGRRVDPPLSGEGRDEASRLGDRLHLGEPTGPIHVVRSPTRRTEETAEVAGLPVDAIDDGWIERDLGDWEGRPWEELWAEAPDAIQTDPEAFAAFTPPGGEPFTQLRERIVDALTRLVHVHDGQGTAVVVCHGGPITHAIGHVLELSPAVALRLRVGTATVTELRAWGEGRFTLDRFSG